MNAGGVDKACKSSGTYFEGVAITSRRRKNKFSGERVSNTLVTYPKVGHSSSKGEVIPDGPSFTFGFEYATLTLCMLSM